MQSVRLKKPHLLSILLIAFGMLPCHAQDTQTAPATKERFDVGAGAFYQVSGASNGNFIREDTTSSGGGVVSFRQPYRPWLGYSADLGFTKFYEAYGKGLVKVNDNVTDFSVSYLLEAPPLYGVQPYFTIGGGIIVFSPIAGSLIDVNGTLPSSLKRQLLPEFTYSLGLSLPVFRRLGVRGGLRGSKYKTPDFHQISIDTMKLRNTLEPTLSVYYRF